MKIVWALIGVTGLIAISCAPGHQGGSFSGMPGAGPGWDMQRGSGSSARATSRVRPDLPESAAPATPDEESPQHRRSRELFPADPAYGDEGAGDFFIRPKHEAIHI